MSSILKALKKIEGRKVDTSLPAWPYGPDSPELMDRHISRCRRGQKILGVLIILCGIALAFKLYIGSRQKPEDSISQTAAPSIVALPQEPAEDNKTETPTNDGGRTRSTPAPESPPRAVSPETARPSVSSPPPVESAQTTKPEPSREPAELETFGTPPSGNAGLSLMALVWSPQPASRFAVINGKIVQEGAGVEGSTIVRIEEDYIVIRTDGVTWKLK